VFQQVMVKTEKSVQRLVRQMFKSVVLERNGFPLSEDYSLMHGSTYIFTKMKIQIWLFSWIMFVARNIQWLWRLYCRTWFLYGFY